MCAKILDSVGVGGEIANAGFTIYNTNGEISAGNKSIANYAADLGMSPDQLLAYSQTARDYYDELSGKHATNLSKTGASSAVSIAAGAVGTAVGGPVGGIAAGLGVGFLTGKVTDGMVDYAAGSKEHVALSMQSLDTAYAKIQNGVPIDATDVAGMLNGQLNQSELNQIKTAIGKGGAENKSLASIYDELDTVKSTAAALLGDKYDPIESATYQIAQKLNEGGVSPAVILIDSTKLEGLLIDNGVQDFGMSPRSQNAAAVRMSAADMSRDVGGPLPPHGAPRRPSKSRV